ncbi:MAG: response regulator [Lachnospiraceae bacterium]
MKIVIVDDDPLVSASLQIILEQHEDAKVVQILNSGQEAIDWIRGGNETDLMLLDIRMENINGLEAAEEILKINSQIKIIFLTTFLDDEYISKALSVGAYGYLLKQDCASLPAAVRAVAAGQKVYGSKIVEKLPDMLNRTNKFDFAAYDISRREQEVIQYVADGLSNKEIADKLYLGEGTVRNMVSTILSKLDLRDRTQLAIFYYQRVH